MSTDAPSARESVAEDTEVVAPVLGGSRRRRPSGAAPPLPRHLGWTGKVWLVASSVLLVWLVSASWFGWTRRVTNQVDSEVLQAIARLRTDWLTDVMDKIDRLGSGWAMTFVAAALLVAIVVFRRWRHLFTLLGAVVVLEVFGQLLYNGFDRPRPYGVTIIGRWAGFAFPAAPLAVLTFVVVGITYTLVVPGRPRSIAKVVGTCAMAVFAAAELYLATFNPSDIIFAAAIAVAVPLAAFRIFTPNEVSPVRYGAGKTAHLDVGGRRGEAIRDAVHTQLGLTVVDIAPVGLAGSGGSTPLLITVEGGSAAKLFGKVYAMNHVRADRWYKLGRMLLYGRLEDEAPFHTVRRLAQYEDYALRLFRDMGLPTAEPYGIVEITPEREYLVVTEFFDGAEEIGEAPVDDGVIDEGLRLIRKLWDAGVAHRDIKPANLLVRDGHVLLIDVAFMQVNPSPWRQAVDLANMMLVLAVRTDAARVYQHALRYFTPDEIAEAFAAARGIASPSQLRAVMKQDGRDLLAEFRALAPARRPIALQRWSIRRIALGVALLVATLVVVPNAVGLFSPAHNIEVSGAPNCGTDNLMILMAQSVPSATSVPCIGSLPAGWSVGGVRIRNGEGRFWLDSDIAGRHAAEATLLPPGACAVSDATEVPSDEVDMRRFERPERLPPDTLSTRTYLFEGGCVRYRFDFEEGATAELMFDAESALAFESRFRLIDEVHRRTGLDLCGAGAACPGGS